MKRRDFIKLSAMTPIAVDLALNKHIQAKDMKIWIFNTKWGYSGSYDSFFAKTQASGYHGVELGWPANVDEQKEIFDGLKKYNLRVGFLAHGGGSNAAESLSNYEKTLNAIVSNAYQKPDYINCHAGKDHYTFEENAKIIEFTLKLEASSGIEIFHETHRGRICYSAPITERFMDQFPKMKLNLDASHWACVHESLLEDQAERMAKVFKRVGLIHTRIGHQEGPQVNDPRAPEWKYTVDMHLSWWDKCLKERVQSGFKNMYLMTEFGPPTYLPTLPYTRQPVADQWEINVYMLNFLKERYQIQ